MVNIYGRSDSENALISYLDGFFREVKINSLQEYEEFSKYPNKIKKKRLDELDREIEYNKNRISELKNDNYRLNNELRKTNYLISKKYTTLKRVYGPLKDEIRDELEYLKFEKEGLQREITENKESMYSTKEKLTSLYPNKRSVVISLDRDICKLEDLKRDIKFKKILAGSWGERKVIDFFEEQFCNENDYHLINAFDIDLGGKAVNFNDKILVENKIDHILVCPKGVIILETKQWSNVTQQRVSELIMQLKKIQKVFDEVFKQNVRDNLSIIVISTAKPIDIPKETGVISLGLDQLREYIMTRDSVIGKDEISLILDELSSELDAGHLSTGQRTVIEFKATIVRGKNKLKSFFRKT